MDKEVKISIGNDFTRKSLSFLLILSVIATLLGFGTAYNEHRSLIELSDKYDEALEKIENCEASVSELSQQIAMQEIQFNQINTTTTTDYYEITDEESTNEYFPEEYYTAQNINTETANNITTEAQTTTVSSAAVSDAKYYVTKSGSKYHVGTCSFLSKSKIAITMDRIKAQGYTPCSRCIK